MRHSIEFSPLPVSASFETHEDETCEWLGHIDAKRRDGPLQLPLNPIEPSPFRVTSNEDHSILVYGEGEKSLIDLRCNDTEGVMRRKLYLTTTP